MEKKIDLLQLQIEALRADANKIKQFLKELHATQTGSLYTISKEKKLIPKQKKQVEAEKELTYLQE